jgi:hypothetical protein
MATKYTPGPWTVDSYGSEPAIRLDGGAVVVPQVWGAGIHDARLIAAAPELLAACEAVAAFRECEEAAD